MKTRKLGQLEISAMGLGCMGMSEFYGPADHEAGLKTIKRALQLGVNFFDTADIYGRGTNECLLAEALNDTPRHQVMIATKCGIVRDEKNPTVCTVNTTPAYIKQCCNDSLKRLNTDYIDLFYLHRLDQTTPVEESMRALAELVKEGKIRHIGLCEVDADTIRRAHAIHPLTAIQSEYSLWCRTADAILPVCRELNIGFVAYSPIGRGFLSGEVQSSTPFGQNDFRHYAPRFNESNLKSNLQIIEYIKKTAESKQVTPAQLAIAWVLAQGNDIVPIPGTTKIKHLESNLGSLNIVFTKEELAYLNDMTNVIDVKGERYPAQSMKSLK